MMRAFVLGLLVAAGGAALVFACSSAGFAPYCTGIPAGGCLYDESADGSTNCGADPTCAALYSANSSCAWTLVQKCPGYTPRPDGGAARDGSADASRTDAGFARDAHLRDVGFVLPPGAGGGPGCEDLESPDCPLEQAVVCGVGCCGCSDLYVCADGGWNDWGECDDAGEVVAYEY
jgi:hypothetical protein